MSKVIKIRAGEYRVACEIDPSNEVSVYRGIDGEWGVRKVWDMREILPSSRTKREAVEFAAKLLSEKSYRAAQ